MKKLQKFIAFSLIGLSAIGSYNVIDSMVKHDISYHQNIAHPAAQVQETTLEHINKIIPIKSYQESTKHKAYYQERINSNLALLIELTTKEPQYQEKLKNLPIFIKDNTVITDKISAALMNFAGLLGIENNHELATGKQLMWSTDIAINEKEEGQLVEGSQAVYIGLKAITDTSDPRQKQLLDAFKGNQEMMFDYMFFHELGHYLSHNFKGNEGNIEYNFVNKIVESFEQQQVDKLSLEDKSMIRMQFTECVGDVMALQLLYLKHPQLKEDKNLVYRLAKARASDSNDVEHLTSVALLSYEAVVKKNNTSLEEILTQSRNAAMASAEFYSPMSFVESKPSLKRQTLINITKGRLNYLDMHDKMTGLDKEIKNRNVHK